MSLINLQFFCQWVNFPKILIVVLFSLNLTIPEPNSRRTIGSAEMMDGLYYFNSTLSSNKKAQGLCDISLNSAREEILLWHLRLGHPSFQYLKHLFPTLFKNVDCSFKCEVVLAKSHPTTYISKPYRASTPISSRL